MPKRRPRKLNYQAVIDIMKKIWFGRNWATRRRQFITIISLIPLDVNGKQSVVM